MSVRHINIYTHTVGGDVEIEEEGVASQHAYASQGARSCLEIENVVIMRCEI